MKIHVRYVQDKNATVNGWGGILELHLCGKIQRDQAGGDLLI